MKIYTAMTMKIAQIKMRGLMFLNTGETCDEGRHAQ